MLKIVAYFGLLAVACQLAAAGPYDQEPKQNNLLPRLGHFKYRPYIDLYKSYAAAFVLPLHSDRPKDDYRNYMPSGAECMVFLNHFRINNYQLEGLDKLVLLDGCLGYLFAGNERQIEEDKKSSEKVKTMREQFCEDQKLRDMYDGAKVNELGEDAKHCVADLLFNSILAKRDYPDVACNNHIIQLYIQFAECQNGTISEEEKSSGTYLKTIYSMVKENARLCLIHEADHIQNAVRTLYARGMKHEVYSLLGKLGSRLYKQASKRMWPMSMVRLLAAAQNTTTEVNQREIHGIVRGIVKEDQTYKKRFLANMAQYADQEAIRIKTDPTGQLAYERLVDRLCRKFRSADHESLYDFATPYIRLVQMLNHKDVFGIEEQDMVDKLLRLATDPGAIYLSVQLCNILTYTEGAYKVGGPPRIKKHYEVRFKGDTTGMVVWPDLGYY